jgi:hypothetical protein
VAGQSEAELDLRAGECSLVATRHCR